MLNERNGRYAARPAEAPKDLEAVMGLRQQVFRGAAAATDADAFDPICRHVLVEDRCSAQIVAAFRLLVVASGKALDATYSAQFYGLSALESHPGPMAELGRFCLAPGCHDPDILRAAWGAIAAIVAEERVDILFGCTSFPGIATTDHAHAFALLAEKHLGPDKWRPEAKAQHVYPYARELRGLKHDPRLALKAMPPLLRTYLAMGGWVSDHAVIDHDLGTTHVFTGLEVRDVPARRAQSLSRLAQFCP
ncbi:MAG: GNAT family N-acyltransferase [Albidovulum sp.]